jgi:AraC-like DNA-binding protein
MSRKRHSPEDEPHFLVRSLASEHRDGDRLPPHTHRWDQLIYAVAGVVSARTAQGSWVVPPHQAVWAPAGVAHDLTFSGASALRTLYLRPGLASMGAVSAVVAVTPLLRELTLRAVALGMLDEREPVQAAMVQLIVHELRARPTASLDLPWPRSPLLRRVAEQLLRAPGERTSHRALGRQVGVSVRTLERGFLAETGLPLGRWHRQARFHHSLRRLGGGAAVKEAALEAGYRSPSAFVAAFRASFGTTPGRYFAAVETAVADRVAGPSVGI